MVLEESDEAEVDGHAPHCVPRRRAQSHRDRLAGPSANRGAGHDGHDGPRRSGEAQAKEAAGEKLRDGMVQDDGSYRWRASMARSLLVTGPGEYDPLARSRADAGTDRR